MEIRQRLRYERPKSLRMIEFTQVAELMHDDVIDERGRKLYKAVIEIEIPARGAAAPASPLIAYRDAVDRTPV